MKKLSIYGPHLTMLYVIESGRLKCPAINGELFLPSVQSIWASNILFLIVLPSTVVHGELKFLSNVFVQK